ncbi:MAG TPA: DNA recombination protein RmuC [Acidobacteriaceae bacterium]
MSEPIALLLGVIVGVIVGAIAGHLIGKQKAAAAEQQASAERQLREQSEQSLRAQLEAARAEAAHSRQEYESRQAAKSAAESQLAQQTTLAQERANSIVQLQSQLQQLRDQLATLQETDRAQAAQIKGLTTTLEKERENAHEKLKLLTEARTELTHQFEALAGKILDEKSTKFTEQNKQNLDQLLNPLRTQITEFRGKVEEAQKESIEGRTEFRTRLEQLASLNQQLSAEAHNLTTALRGSSKTQGDWGEFILRDLLDKAGLREGEQYRFQQGFSAATDEDGQRGKASRTDVIVHLPGGRHLIIDSKVSLNAYSDYCNAIADDVRKSSLKLHLAAIRKHCEDLSGRRYHKLSGLDSPDFVVMFIPIEPAFLLAMQHGADLWREAYDRNVLLVGPTTLLFVIRIVDNLWQQEQQARSVQEIVDRGTKLSEKFISFVSDLESVGDSLRKADKSYNSAFNKLKSGPGNLIKQVALLQKAGIRTNKQLPARLLEEAGIDAEEQAELSLAASSEHTDQL